MPLLSLSLLHKDNWVSHDITTIYPSKTDHTYSNSKFRIKYGKVKVLLSRNLILHQIPIDAPIMQLIIQLFKIINLIGVLWFMRYNITFKCSNSRIIILFDPHQHESHPWFHVLKQILLPHPFAPSYTFWSNSYRYFDTTTMSRSNYIPVVFLN